MKFSSKPAKIRYNFSGKWDDVSDFLRQYSTADVLKKINKESTELFLKKSGSDIPAVKHVSFSLYHKNSRIPEKQEAYIMAWALIDLAYYIIKTSNDYRGKKIEFNEELYMLQISVDNYKEREESFLFENFKEGKENDFFMYLWGFAGEQFKFENPKIVFDNFSRDLYILFELNDSNDFDMENVLQNEIGMSWEKVVSYLMIAWFGFTQVSTLEEMIEKIPWCSDYSKSEFERVIDRYTTNYDAIKNSVLGRQMLYAKPFVKTQKGEIVSISPYLNFFLCEHSVLWLIRDYFNKQKSQDFTNYFGDLFEKYFNEILSSCLENDEYERIIETGKDERADWKLCIGDYKFLVEQKSTIMRLSAKQQQTDISAIKEFAKRTVIKAMSQLANTEKEFGEGKYIKIILLFEDYLKPELLDQLIEMPECNVKNDKYFWLVTIEEMEMLLYLSKSDRLLFNRIIKEKIDREVNHSNVGKSIIQLLNENGINKNEYIRQEKFLKFRNIVQEKAKELL